MTYVKGKFFYDTMRKTLLIALGLFTNFQIEAQPQRPFVQKFTPSEFGQQYSANTFAVDVDSSGMVYVGTAYGILQFDGTNWRFINVKVGTYVTALKVINNTVFVGCYGDFGFLRSDEKGLFRYHSLVDKVPEDDLEFTRIWKIVAFDNHIAFQAEEKIFLLRNDSVQTLNPTTSFHLSFGLNNQFLVRERGRGLLVYNGSSFETIKGSEMFADLGVFAVIPQGNSSILLTRESGFWKWENQIFSKLQVSQELESILLRSEVINALRLDDGNIAINTLKNGILILNSNLQIVSNYSASTGLLSSEIFDMAQDGTGDLWAATQKGVNRIQYTSAFSLFGPAEGIYGEVLTVSSFGKGYVVGTTSGLFVSAGESIKAYAEVEVVGGSVWKIIEAQGSLWVATDNGLWRYNGTDYYKVNRTPTTALVYVKEKDWLVGVGPRGLYVLNSNLTVMQTFPDIKVDAYGLAYSITPKGDCELWVGSKTSGAWQVVITPDLKQKLFDVYGPLDGLEEDWVCPYPLGNSKVFATSRGLLKFISAEEIYRMLNDSTMSIFDIRGMFSPIDLPKNAVDNAITALLYGSDTTFIGIDFNVHVVNMRDSISSDFELKALRVGKLNALEKHSEKLLIGGRDGLAIAQLGNRFKRSYPIPQLLLRSISFGSDSVVWWGDAPQGMKSIEIPFTKNSLVVLLTSPYNDNGLGAEYSWRVKGTNRDFSQWSALGTVEINNLREGQYVFEAIARNIHGQQSEMVTFSFRVLPPWYRTIYAYISYALALVALVYLLVQMNIKRLKAQNKRLEELVQQRTREVVEQKEHIEQQKERIEDILRDIRASINYAQRIQQALLPSRDLIEKFLPEHFIIFYPRDVVSGDFYWATRVKDWVVVTVADCTGHGVPGAFMSMLGISLLNEIVGKQSVVEPSRILGDMRQGIIEALKQGSEHATQKDGLDMSIVAINLKTRVCKWAGANNPLYIVRSRTVNAPLTNMNEKNKLVEFDCCTLLELKQDRMPVAIHTVMEDFSSHEVQLQAGDRLYMFSDGYTDQFGGNDYRKFMSKAFKELVATTSGLPIDQQGRALETAFREWVNCNGQMHEQIDDVTVLGIKV